MGNINFSFTKHCSLTENSWRMTYFASIFCLMASFLSSYNSTPHSGPTVYQNKNLFDALNRSSYTSLPPIDLLAEPHSRPFSRTSLMQAALPLQRNTLRVLIHEQKSLTTHTRTGRQAEYLVSTVASHSSIGLLEEGLNPEIPLPAQLELLHSGPEGLREIHLPASTSKKLISYLLLGPPVKPFDCGSFASYLSGFDVHKFRSPAHFSRLYPEQSAPANRVVAISKTHSPALKDIVHYAYSLGNGLYISKFGTRGKLRITDLEQMQEFYSGRSVHVLSSTVQSHKSSTGSSI